MIWKAKEEKFCQYREISYFPRLLITNLEFSIFFMGVVMIMPVFWVMIPIVAKQRN